MNNRSMLSNPLVLGIGGLLVGLLIGWFVFGWALFPVQYTNADIYDLNPAAKATWIVTVADAYSVNQDLNAARERLRGFTQDEITQALRAGIVERNTKGDAPGAARLQAMGQLLGLALGGGTATVPRPTTTPQGARSGSLLDNLGMLLLLLAGLILLLAAVLFLYQRFMRPSARPMAPAAAAPGAPINYTAPAPGRLAPDPSTGLREPLPSAPPMTAPPSPRAPVTSAAKSLGTFAATYKFGEDNYDTSFTLETSRGEFLGETGMGSSETIGDGKPDKVTAFDVWLFDKTDVRTVTQILMSEFAFNDQQTRQRLATKGELVMAEKGKRVRLETATLGVDAEIVDLVYASTPGLPPNSHFQKLIVEMVPAQK